MNGAQAANKMMEMIEKGRKFEAIKAVRAIEPNIYVNLESGQTASIGILDAKLFVEAIQAHMEKLTPDAFEVELSHYKKLREAGFSISEAVRILEALK